MLSQAYGSLLFRYAPAPEVRTDPSIVRTAAWLRCALPIVNVSTSDPPRLPVIRGCAVAIPRRTMRQEVPPHGSPKSSKVEFLNVTPRPDVHLEETYSGDWTEAPQRSVGWTLLNWVRERPVALQVVGSA